MKSKLERIGIACVLIWPAILAEPASAIGSIAVARSSFMLPVSAKNYRHCHNTPRHVYCHTKELLPVTVREEAPTNDSMARSPHASNRRLHLGESREDAVQLSTPDLREKPSWRNVK